jgi:hypothetical protein
MDVMDDQLISRALGPKAQVETLEEENARLQEALDECKARILELNREDTRFTDRDARTKFDDLHSFIEDWLNEFLDRDTKNDVWEKGTSLERYSKRYNSVGIPKALFPLSPREPDLLSAITWLSEKQCRDRFMLSLVTWDFLEKFVFNENLPSGTGTWSRRARRSRIDGDIPFIDGVHKVLVDDDQTSSGCIRTLQSYGNALICSPGRLPRASKWRSETLTAMIQTPRFSERQNRNIEELTKVFEWKLLGFTRPSDPDELKDFCRQCLRLATELQTQLLCCLSAYEVVFPSLYKQVQEDVSKKWNFRHIDTWRAVTHHADVRLVRALIPGLYRKVAAEGQSERVEVVRPLMIVCGVDDNFVMRANQSPSSGRATRYTSRSREATLPRDEAKPRKSVIYGYLTRLRKTNVSWTPSDDRGARPQRTLDTEFGQRIGNESYNENGGNFVEAAPDQEPDKVSSSSDELVSSSDGRVSRQSLARRCQDLVHDNKSLQTHRRSTRDCRGITGLSTDRSSGHAERPEHSEYRAPSSVTFAKTMHDVGLPATGIASN